MVRFITLLVGLVMMPLTGAQVYGQAATKGAAQDYPNRPIRVFTSEPGGGTDFAARQVAQAIAGPLGQPVVVENRVQLIAIETVATAAPDGYSLLATGPSFWVGPLFRKANYDPIKDFSPIVNGG